VSPAKGNFHFSPAEQRRELGVAALPPETVEEWPPIVTGRLAAFGHPTPLPELPMPHEVVTVEAGWACTVPVATPHTLAETQPHKLTQTRR
jgi:hypothetical protein